MATLSAHPYHTSLKHLENGTAVFSGRWAIGATGAVGAKTGGLGMNLTRTGVGTYRIDLVNSKGVVSKVPAILGVHIAVEEADADPTDDTAAYAGRPLVSTPASGTITLQTHDEAFVARDPASGAFLLVTVFVNLSSVTR